MSEKKSGLQQKSPLEHLAKKAQRLLCRYLKDSVTTIKKDFGFFTKVDDYFNVISSPCRMGCR